ncbi:pyridoxal phosphate-dependent transferase [Halteromyces radiatus]|uniref:pyridoxal phosphate-dependent transferase n=1 Tax=Halteromyces radiatus TaxID=101107 RepID=UPI002220F0FB|nr:pyridoxal phosphate-dependent transferase [Halteromyces radiatus]KAI8099387.1 pyridoxal phosphate-dependent transferase [Halteromyces radiatus]
MDYRSYLSDESKNRQPSPIRALAPFVARKGMISLGAGNPNPDTFPYESMQLTLKTGQVIQVDAEHFKKCLSYDLTSGFSPLNQWLKGLQQVEHKPKVEFGLTIGVGSQDLITKALQMFINPGTPILVENPTYTGVLSFLKSQPCQLVGVSTDASGLMPDELQRILQEWPIHEKPRPRILYVIPSGQNPSGVSASFERKQEIYSICQKYGILILEDDPYYYLQFRKDRIPSYLSIDVDGRVLRFDSLSKILSSGLRIGFATGPQVLIDQINIHSQSTNLQPSGISQLAAYELLEKWGYDGFDAHVRKVSSFYEDKAKAFIELLERHMKGYAEWDIPDSGMFVWMKLLGGITDSKEVIMTKATARNVVAVPGEAFLPNGGMTPYVRLSFSNVSYEEADEALRRLAIVIQEEAALNGVTIENH